MKLEKLLYLAFYQWLPPKLHPIEVKNEMLHPGPKTLEFFRKAMDDNNIKIRKFTSKLAGTSTAKDLAADIIVIRAFGSRITEELIISKGPLVN